MKALKITLKSLIWFCIFAIIALLFARILIADYYPGNMTDFKYTESVKNKYTEIENLSNIYTQDLMAPYDDAKDGNFFATAMLCMPDSGMLQACVRYNNSTLPKIAEFYGKEELPSGDALSLFTYTLTVSYETDDDTAHYVSYPMSIGEALASDFMMYHYAKIVFENVDFEKAVWMRVDISLAGEENTFGSIVLYEAYEVFNGKKIAYPLEPYELSEREKKSAR